ncbi:MAG: amidohydrolase family protein [Candidatus Methanoplasma sp.]|jgi:cytosine/adenosine deaminase-related metal-dependent hydrolase|nr:amidohydrolase family protein [Candidatus Methanoplasma sp.]
MDVLSGSVLTDDDIISGYVCIEGGRVVAIEEGKPSETPLATGLVMPPMVNSHTHCADAGLKIRPGMTIDDLVAPPNGLKHRYLRSLTAQQLENNISRYAEISNRNGIGIFIDFREGGEEGCRILRKTAPGSVILGRPLSEEYDYNEMNCILGIADGIGISSISDMNTRHLEQIADHTRRANKILAIHASEKEREDMDLILSLDPTFIVHMVEATDSDLLKCAESEVPIVVCARSNRYFGKVPPVKRMLECGADIAIGTDNAMLCDPDMRSEASVFRDILVSQGGLSGDVADPMLRQGRKILYPHNKIHVSVGMPADLTVLPCPGEFQVDRMLRDRGGVFRYKPETGESK